MPHRNRENLRKFIPNTHIASNSQPSLFFGGCEFEDPLREQAKIFEEEEEGEPIPTDPMTENRNDRGDIEKELRVPFP